MGALKIQPSKGLLDFYNNQVLKKDSVWNKYAGQKSITYIKPWDQLTPGERSNIKNAYENFKKVIPTLRKITQQSLIPVEEAGQILGIPERRGPPMPKYSKGRLTSGFSITISDAMTRGTAGGERIGSGQEIIKKVLKPKFKLQQLNVGLGEGNKRWFIKDPRKIEGGTKILQDYYLRKGRKTGIMPKVMDRVKALHRTPTIIELLKEGNFDNGRALAAIQNKWGWTPSEASTAVFRLAQAYNGKKFFNVDFNISQKPDVAKSIFKAIDKAPWGSAFHTRGYQIAMDTITENLGEKYFQKGSMDTFKREIRTILRKEKIPVYDIKVPKAKRYGFNLNEMIGVTPAARTGSHPYSQFVNLMEGKFNQGHYAAYVKNLGAYQDELQAAIKKGDPSSVIKKFNMYNTEFRDLHNLQKGDLPTLSLKDPSKLYSATRLKELSAQGLDLPEHFKKAKYSIGVGEAPTLKEIRETPELIKKINRIDPLKKIVEARVGCADGCLAKVAKNEPGKITQVLETLPQKVRTFLGFLGKVGPAAGKFGAIAAAGAIAQPLVKQFVNDDPSTYLTDPEQQAGMLEALIEGERPRPRSEILDTATTAGALGATAAAIPGTGALWKARRQPFTKMVEGVAKTRPGMGVTRAALGPVGKFIAGAYTPAGILATEPLRIAQMRREGESWGEVAKSPTLWMGPAFADTMTRMATAGMKGSPRLAKALSLGMSRPMLKTISRRFGMPGLALSLGLSGYDQYQDYKKKRGFFARDEE
tara:strand:+ start:230 stop:2503 length:2274 start_codon:yes stop_codon:yes gene_type:complete